MSFVSKNDHGYGPIKKVPYSQRNSFRSYVRKLLHIPERVVFAKKVPSPKTSKGDSKKVPSAKDTEAKPVVEKKKAAASNLFSPRFVPKLTKKV